MSIDERYLELQKEKFDRALAKILGLTYEELCELGYSMEDYTGHDDQVHSKIIRFQGDCNKYCNGIPGLKSNQIFLSLEDWYRLQNSVGNSDD